MLPIKWRKAAHADLWQIIDYISDDNPQAAIELKADIEGTIENLPKNPKIYRPGRIPGTREIVINKNYIIVYAELAGTLWILRILHSARKWP